MLLIDLDASYTEVRKLLFYSELMGVLGGGCYGITFIR